MSDSSKSNTVILGKKLVNPFSTANIRKAKMALKKAGYKSATKLSSSADTAVEVTDLYVRFLPKDNEELALLHADSTLHYYTYPLDYEIVKEGEEYHDPSIPANKITWLYAGVPVDYKFGSIKYELIDSLHRPDSTEAVLQETTLALAKNPELDVKTQILQNKTSWFWNTKFRPSGRVYVRNTVTGRDEPLQYMNVIAKFWFWNAEGTTDANGYFSVNDTFTSEVGMYLGFRSNVATIRKGFNEWIGLWVSEKVGNQKGYSDYYINRNSDNEDRTWRKASVHQAVVIYDRYAFQNNIKRPSDVNIWLKENTKGSVTLMLHGRFIGEYLTGNNSIDLSQNATANLYLKGLLIAYTTNTSIALNPDIIFDWDGFTNTQIIYETVFHELTHYSHFYKAGGMSYWRGVAKHTISINDGSYGRGDEPLAGYSAVTEGFAFHTGFNLAETVLGRPTFTTDGPSFGFRSSSTYQGLDEDFRPYQVPVIVRSDSQDAWIPVGLFRDLEDDTPGETVSLRNTSGAIIFSTPDNIQGLTASRIYALLTAEVNSIPALREKIKVNYPTINSVNLDNLFRAYGF